MFTDSYLAGFFDGEGCVYIGKRGKNFRVGVRVHNMGLRPLQAFKERFGGYVCTCTSGVHMWELVGLTRLPEFIKIMGPLLVVKKEQLAVLEEYVDMGAVRRGGRMTSSFRADRVRLMMECSALKGSAGRLN